MRKVSVGRMALSLREEFTSVALKRSANIDNCAPNGYFNIIQAVALTAFDGDPKPVSTIREKYNSGIKDSKEIMENCARLTAQPFPIIESTKKRTLTSDETINSPLYDESTGVVTQERYANVVLSPLGRLLTRHYRDAEMSSIENYNSIVPLSLLRKSLPWTMGHRSEMQPLNPSELFTIMDKMLEMNSPFVDNQFLLENFRGVDVGEKYNIFTNTKSLLRLYTRGEASLIVMPEIEIRRKENKIIIKRPPLDSTTKKLITYLRTKSTASEQKQYPSFRFQTKVDMVGNEAHINVKRFISKNDAEIIQDFLNDQRIAKKIYIKNETIIFKEKPSKRSVYEEDSFLGKPTEHITLSDMREIIGEMDEEEKKNLNINDFSNFIEQYKIKMDIEPGSMTDEELKQLETDSSGRFKLGGNPYNFEMDLIPVYEVLWRCILGERRLLQAGLKKKLEEEKKKLEYDLLLEKATRPEVAKVIYELQPKRDRIKLLLERTQPGSELLEEGFLAWEVEEIYKSRGNNILPNIFDRDRFKDLHAATKRRIQDLVDKIDNPEILNKMIRDDIRPFIREERYKRKSKVYFIPDRGVVLEEEKKEIVKQKPYIGARHDGLDLPCTLYYDHQSIIRNYGVNMYFDSFIPAYELNTTNLSDIQIFVSDPETNKVSSVIQKVNKIPTERATRFGTSIKSPSRILGVIPVEKGKDFIIWTSKGRFLAYHYQPGNDFGLQPDEVILGWEYYDKQFLDVRGSQGVQTLEKTEFPKFRVGLKDLYEPMGTVYDMLNKAHSDRVIRIRNTVNNKDHYKTRRQMWKTKYAKPVELHKTKDGKVKFDSVFSQHRTMYFGGVYIPRWRMFGLSGEEKYLPPKKVKLTEYAWVDDNTKASKDLFYKIYSKMHSKRPERLTEAEQDEYRFIHVVARFTNSYLDFDLEEFERFGIIDARALEIYKKEQKQLELRNETRQEMEDRIEMEQLSWSDNDMDDNELEEALHPKEEPTDNPQEQKEDTTE